MYAATRNISLEISTLELATENFISIFQETNFTEKRTWDVA